MLEFSVLDREQIFGDNCLEIFKKRGRKGYITEFAMILGGMFLSDVHKVGTLSVLDKAGTYWTKTNSTTDRIYYCSILGSESTLECHDRSVGCRPIIAFSDLEYKCCNKKMTSDGVLEVEYGEYPQKVVSETMQKELNTKYNNRSNILCRTGKCYEIDAIKNSQEEKYKPLSVPEYLYKGKKYVYICTTTCYTGTKTYFESGHSVQEEDWVWVEVLPVKWLVDEKEDIAMSEKVLFSGIQFNNINYYDGDFEKTNLKKYLNENFSFDIEPSVLDIVHISELNKKINLQNAYEFNFEKISEEDLIRGSLESNITPFLHGKSSDGKSARIKQFDPDAEIVYLRNATPDSLNGKSVYNAEKNEMIDVPPTWYVKLKEKCEAEPDKLHIVFFDELTNALPSIQGMAFNIILDKEINGKWKLPENARVAAAGNDLEDSLAANTMAEPLFNRFNHVYINTTVDDWLSWALTPNNLYERLDYKKEDTTKQLKIHPAIYAYIACKKDGVLRTKFTGIKPNADPRKWEMASKVLYKTNNPYMLRGLIGKALTEDFASFCKTKVITLEDVINGNYDNKIFEINSSEKYLTTLALSNVDEKNLEVVRNFIERFGKEYLALFDSLWTIGDDERLETLMNLKERKIKIKTL